ncbi:excisionase [Bradyrhizobium sp. HKCCYLS3077]|uniref:excisionase n=1 Tax=Bradyrhizobium sp. HKCCYLS3077 TaxID=3420761 RepID=UPI003EB856BB
MTEISPDTPLRLAKAAEVAFPGGGMTASGLRKEATRGRLVIERIAGKDYTTLAAIARMRELCRIEPKITPSRRPEPAPGLSENDLPRIRLDRALEDCASRKRGQRRT